MINRDSWWMITCGQIVRTLESVCQRESSGIWVLSGLGIIRNTDKSGIHEPLYVLKHVDYCKREGDRFLTKS